MWLDLKAQRLLDSFWERCGEAEPFPRSLERSIALALPVAIVRLPRLRISSIESWLHRRQAGYSFRCQDRALRGCLLAHRGRGLIFVDGIDPEDERRFTIAHELAHFLLDYWSVRDQAIRALGPTISEVMDGFRPATLTERVGSALSGVPIGVHCRLLERGKLTGDLEHCSIGLENRADRVALTLLAPPAEVFSRVNLGHPRFEARLRTTEEILRRDFGLPECFVSKYAHILLTAARREETMAEHLRK